MEYLEGTLLSVTDSPYDYDRRLKELATALRNGEKLDFNSLCHEERNIVFALVESGEADFHVLHGRRVVQQSYLAKHPLLGLFVHVLSMGAGGYTPLDIE